MQELEFRAMGSHMLALIDRDEAVAQAALDEVPVWFEEWEQQLSRFRVDSDLMRLNAANGQPVAVPSALFKVLEVAMWAARMSEGLVRPTTLDALVDAGYDRSFDTLAREQDRHSDKAHTVARWQNIALDKRTQTVTLPRGVHLDLGGVAKGWAADQAMRRLAAIGPALVDAGGDIAVSGPMADGSPWPIAIANPFAPDDNLGLLLVVQGAVATSGRDFRRWKQGGAERHHIIDPRTGKPAMTDVLSATVVAPDGPLAETAAKSALILGSRAGIAWLDERPTLAGVLVLDDGRVVRSRRMDIYLDQTNGPITAATIPDAATN